jgi:hypothetical protein
VGAKIRWEKPERPDGEKNLGRRRNNTKRKQLRGRETGQRRQQTRKNEK